MLPGKIVTWCYLLPRVFISVEKDHQLVENGQLIICVCFPVFSMFLIEL